jgi:hypothetical protein
MVDRSEASSICHPCLKLRNTKNSALLFVVHCPVPRVLSVFVYSTIQKRHYSAVIGYDGSGLSYNLAVSLGSSQKRTRSLASQQRFQLLMSPCRQSICRSK